jgi:hypothetical protein
MSEGREGVADSSFSNDDEDRPAIEEIVVIDHHDKGSNDSDEGGGTSLGLDPTNLFGMPGNNPSFGYGGGGNDLLAAASATASTVASTSFASTSAASARGKRLSGASTVESVKKKSRALTKPLRNV